MVENHSVLACGPRVLFLPTKQSRSISARPIYSHDNVTWKPEKAMESLYFSRQCAFSRSGQAEESEMGAIHKMAPVGVCGALLHTGPCWMYGWLREAEKNSPSESYILLLWLEYA